MRLDYGQIEVMDDAMADIYRLKSIGERLRIANDMFLFARRMMLTQIAADHPDWSENQVHRETARRISNGSV